MEVMVIITIGQMIRLFHSLKLVIQKQSEQETRL